MFGFVAQFNHFVLYNYHCLNRTLTSNIILAGMQALDDQRGYLLDRYAYPQIGATPETILRGFSLQSNIPNTILKLYPNYVHRPNGFFLEITDGIFLSFLVTLVFFSLGAALFNLLRNYRISLLFR